MARILIVHKDRELRDVLHKMLERQDHVVVEAEDPEESSAEFSATSPDIVIADLSRSLSDARRFRKLRSRFPTTPVILTHGSGRYPRVKLLNSAHKLGAVKMLASPFTQTSLRRTVADCLPSAVAI